MWKMIREPIVKTLKFKDVAIWVVIAVVVAIALALVYGGGGG
jgi:hypothetical protein